MNNCHMEVEKLKIGSYSISMESNHALTQNYVQSESLRIVGNAPKSLYRTFGIKPEEHQENPSRQLIRGALNDYLELSKEAATKMQQEIADKQELTIDDIKQLDIPDKDKQQLLLLAKMIKALTGKDIKIVMPKDVKINPSELKIQLPSQAQTPTQHGVGGLDWAARYNYHVSYQESESMSFSAKGIINTSDGKQIQFDVNLSMSRQFAFENDISITMGNKALLDPLVINYDGPAANVTQTKFNFDIDANGTADQLATLTAGSGFLALDKNGDGTINDGSELFGTKSGNGFSDLAAYDTDHNQWIDQNDAVFDKLRIWTVAEDGSKQLFSLGQKGIGAIYLGNVGAQFSITDSTADNATAQARSASIFVKEDGTVGTVQQIDYLV